ncbi:MAG TPA: WbqC family protein [Alphaproteobacteria bacterium]
MIVAIHQPNYFPWLGYFRKIAAADIFIFLDDAQYTKNSYINRVQIAAPAGARWLTAPVSYAFGDPINRVRFARADWRRAHLDALHGAYAKAAAFRGVWRRMSEIYASLPVGNLAAANAAAITALAAELGFQREFRLASTLGVDARGDARLAGLVRAVAPGGVYLSGGGGAKYQSEETFAAAGLTLRYADFVHPRYEQGREGFTPGLSVLDAVFHLGWRGAAELVAAEAR